MARTVGPACQDGVLVNLLETNGKWYCINNGIVDGMTLDAASVAHAHDFSMFMSDTIEKRLEETVANGVQPPIS